MASLVWSGMGLTCWCVGSLSFLQLPSTGPQLHERTSAPWSAAQRRHPPLARIRSRAASDRHELRPGRHAGRTVTTIRAGDARTRSAMVVVVARSGVAVDQ